MMTPNAQAPEAVTKADRVEEFAPKHRTFGNKVFDMVWPLIQVGGVWVASMFVGYQGVYGKNWFSDKMDKAGNRFAQLIARPVNAVNKYAPTFWRAEPLEWGKSFSMWLATMVPGIGLIAVTKVLEDNRDDIAASIDKMAGKVPQDASKVKAEPKQSWLSMYAGRFVASSVSLAAFFALGPKLSTQIAEWSGEKTLNAFQGKNKASVFAQRVATLGVFDFIFTCVSGSVTYLYSRAFARKHNGEFVPEDAADKVFPKTPAPVVELKPDKATYTKLGDKQAGSYARRLQQEPATKVSLSSV